MPGVAHHVMQRGNRGLPVFFDDADRALYLTLLRDAAAASGTQCLAWSLTDNAVQLLLIPDRFDGLRRTLGEAHRRYTRHVNQREDWTGHLFQGRFASYPMDDPHILAALRHVERHPVAAGLAATAAAWRWSSARSHRDGQCGADDPLTDLAALGRHVRNWRGQLRGEPAADAAEAETIAAHLRTGRPLADPDLITVWEMALGRKLAPGKPGRRPKAAPEDAANSPRRPGFRLGGSRPLR